VVVSPAAGQASWSSPPSRRARANGWGWRSCSRPVVAEKEDQFRQHHHQRIGTHTVTVARGKTTVLPRCKGSPLTVTLSSGCVATFQRPVLQQGPRDHEPSPQHQRRRLSRPRPTDVVVSPARPASWVITTQNRRVRPTAGVGLRHAAGGGGGRGTSFGNHPSPAIARHTVTVARGQTTVRPRCKAARLDGDAHRGRGDVQRPVLTNKAETMNLALRHQTPAPSRPRPPMWWSVPAAASQFGDYHPAINDRPTAGVALRHAAGGGGKRTSSANIITSDSTPHRHRGPGATRGTASLQGRPADG